MPLRFGAASAAALVWLFGACAAPLAAGQAAPPLPTAPVTASKKTEKTDSQVVYTEDSEVKLGRENAEENDKHVKLVTDPAIVGRVNRIGQEIAAVANRMPIPALFGSSQLKQFHYTFKVVDDKDVNAYSLPGGFIYVDKGLLDYVHSDDELAGVLGHEITHAAHHHMMKLLNEQKKINNWILPAALIALAAGHGGVQGASQIWFASNLYTIAKLNTYSNEAEKDADHGSILLVKETHYNPVGLYSFMCREAIDERNHATPELGIYRTHPPSNERAAAAKALLESLNIPIHLSDVDPALQVKVKPFKDGPNGVEMAEISTRGVRLCRVVGADGLTAQERAQRIAKRLDTLLDTRLQSFEIRANKEQTRVMVRGYPLLTNADAAAQNTTVTALALEMSQAVTQINEKQQMESNF